MTPLSLSLDIRPRRMAGVTVCRRRDDGKIVLRRDGRYVTVSPRGMDIWNALDGAADLRSLAQTFSVATGRDITAELMALVRIFLDCDLVSTAPADAPPNTRVLAIKRARPPRTVLEGYLTFSPQRWVERSYRRIQPLIQAPLLIAAAVLASVGAAAYLAGGAHPPLRFTIADCASLGFALVLSAIAHEAAHAITLRHFGGDVVEAGVGWYWFVPTVFVNTSDAHLLLRRQRIAVCLAGPASDAVVAGAAAIIATTASSGVLAAWSSAFADIVYMGILWNLNPLLETDWYYALTDLLNRPNLRRDGFDQLSGRGRCRDGVGTSYGIAAGVYAAVYVAYVLPRFVHHTVETWLSPVVSPAVIDVLAVATAIGACIWTWTHDRGGGVRGAAID